LKIIISSIPEDGLNLQFHKDGQWFQELLPEKERNEFSLQRVDVSCTVKRMRETLFINGRLETAVASTCSRCLDATGIPVESTFKYSLVPAKERFSEEKELSSEDLESGFYREDVMDLDGLIFEQIMLQIPIKVICKATCKGLCPHCGINLNASSCDCQAESIDERLAVLKQFAVKAKK